MKLKIVTIIERTEIYDMELEYQWKGVTLKERIDEAAFDSVQENSRRIVSAHMALIDEEEYA